MADPPSQAVTPVGASDTLTRRCICKDPQCPLLLRRVLTETPPDHIWRRGGGFTQIKFRDASKPSPKVEALRRAIVHHLKLDSEESQYKTYFVCNIHWPVAMLEAEGSGLRSTLLSPLEAQQMDARCNYNSNRFVDNRNCFGTLMKTESKARYYESLKLNSEKRIDTNLFVKAPVCTLGEVKVELNAYGRRRNPRPPPIITTIMKQVKFVPDESLSSAQSPDRVPTAVLAADPAYNPSCIEAEAHIANYATPLASSTNVDESPDSIEEVAHIADYESPLASSNDMTSHPILLVHSSLMA